MVVLQHRAVVVQQGVGRLIQDLEGVGCPGMVHVMHHSSQQHGEHLEVGEVVLRGGGGGIMSLPPNIIML